MIRYALSRLFALGRTAAPVDDSGPFQTVRVQINQHETLDARSVITAYGLISSPPEGADAILICASADRSDSAVIGHNHQKYRYAGAKSGEAGFANMVAGTVVIALANGDVYIKPASGRVVVEGGTVTAQDFITTGGVKLSDHVHGGVQSGGSTTQGPQG